MSTTKQTEREKALEAERDDYKAKHVQAEAERDDYKARYEGARDAHNNYQAKYEQAKEAYNAALTAVPLYDDPFMALGEDDFSTVLEIVLGEAHNRGIVTTNEDEDEAEPKTSEPADVDPHAETKGILRRNGLKEAYVMPDGSIQFDKGHALHMVGKEGFESLTKISAE